MRLTDFTSAQLTRMYDRLYPRGYGAWDWTTLRSTFPGRAAAMRAILDTRREVRAHEDRAAIVVDPQTALRLAGWSQRVDQSIAAGEITGREVSASRAAASAWIDGYSVPVATVRSALFEFGELYAIEPDDSLMRLARQLRRAIADARRVAAALRAAGPLWGDCPDCGQSHADPHLVGCPHTAGAAA